MSNGVGNRVHEIMSDIVGWGWAQCRVLCGMLCGMPVGSAAAARCAWHAAAGQSPAPAPQTQAHKHGSAQMSTDEHIATLTLLPPLAEQHTRPPAQSRTRPDALPARCLLSSLTHLRCPVQSAALLQAVQQPPRLRDRTVQEAPHLALAPACLASGTV